MKYYVVNKTAKHNLAQEAMTYLLGVYGSLINALRGIEDSINIFYDVDEVNIKFCLDNTLESRYIGYILVENDERYDIWYTSINE